MTLCGDDILPCPFCGGRIGMCSEETVPETYFVGCEKCGARGPLVRETNGIDDAWDRAAIAWNTRIIPNGKAQ